MSEPFNLAERDAIYRVIAARRDVRRGFLATAVPDEVLLRILDAAHRAPSVGLMQPARFVLVRDAALRRRVHAIFTRANEQAIAGYEGERREAYEALKLEALLEAPLHVCVLCESESAQGHGLGRQTMPEMAVYSTVCAIENLWLAARAEGIGVGWVSILDVAAVRELLRVPERLTLVAYLCVGYVEAFGDAPELEQVGWERRRLLEVWVDRCPEEKD